MRKLLLMLAAICASHTVHAQSTQSSSSTTLTAVVESACKVEATSSIQFGTYDPVNINRTLPARAQGTVSVQCSNGSTNVKMALSQGQNASPSSSCAVPLRRMRSPQNNFLTYRIYQDNSENIVWGCAEETSKTLPTFSSLSRITVPTFGFVEAGQDVSQGVYTDTVEVYVTF